MNYCYDRHTPIYKIKYKPNQPKGLSQEWLVCEKCFGKPEFFGSINEIESIVSLHSSQEIRFKIEHISVMTQTITEKLKKNLRTNRYLK
ncbi:MAG: hypothetical protein ACE5DT_00085 [Nitrosopumilus sp.]